MTLLDMKIDIITLFPNMFRGPFDESIIKRAQDRGLAEINVHFLRKWTHDRHQIVDDRPYGGGVGMLLKIEPIYEALQELKTPDAKVILLDAGGEKFTQKSSQDLSHEKHLIFISPHYEGVDHRIREHLIDYEFSIGDFVLTGGELPTMVMVDSIVRLIPGVLNKEEAVQFESFTNPNKLEHPQYTRPEEFNGWRVPEVLLKGHHAKQEEWKEEESLKRTKKNRPDL